MSDQTTDVSTFLDTWTGVEGAGDHEELGSLLTGDFTGIGPLGFTLPRNAWLERYASGALKYDEFGLDEVRIRLLGDSAAVVTARQNSHGAFGGNPVPESLRLTAVLSKESGGWKLARAQLSFIAGTAGSPALPGRP